MTTTRVIRENRFALLISATTLAALIAWTVLVFSERTGPQIFLLPGSMSIAAAVHPCEPPEPYNVKAGESFEQAFANAYVEHGIRCGLPQYLIALWFSAVFWVAVVPLAVFVVLRRTVKIRRP